MKVGVELMEIESSLPSKLTLYWLNTLPNLLKVASLAPAVTSAM